MVRFFSELPNDPLEDAKNLNDSSEIIDSKANDFSLADSFLNFDSIKDYFEDTPATDMVAQENNKSNRVMKLEKTEGRIEESENLGSSSCTIQEGLGKISLVSESQSLVLGNVGKSEMMNDEHESESSESDSVDPSSPSPSSSYHSNSNSDNGSSSTTSDDDDDDDNEEEEWQEEKGKEKTKHIDVEIEEGEIRDSGRENLAIETTADDEDVGEMVSWSGINHDNVDDSDYEDEESSRHAAKGPIESKNELETLPPVPSVDVTLQPHHQLLAVGVVLSIIGAKVIVEGVEKHDPLNEGSILWITESRRALGFVDEIFGPVKNPYYVVRYNYENEVPEGIRVGTLISFVPEFANHVLNNKDIYKKGYDASGVNDEEMSGEEAFSDDEKEAEFERTHRMTKRGINDQNTRKRRNNRKKVPQREGEVPSDPVGPATTLLAHGNCSTFVGTGQGFLREATRFPPFQPPVQRLNPPTNGVWTNCTTFPQPQSSTLPNALTTNGITWVQENTQTSYQLPVPATPFQQHNPNQASLSTNMMPGVRPNIYQQPMFAPGLVNQNQLTFGMSSNLPQMQPPLCAEQGFLTNEWSERNSNFHSGTSRGRPPALPQFHRDTSANRGRKAFHRGSRNSSRPAN